MKCALEKCANDPTEKNAFYGTLSNNSDHRDIGPPPVLETMQPGILGIKNNPIIPYIIKRLVSKICFENNARDFVLMIFFNIYNIRFQCSKDPFIKDNLFDNYNYNIVQFQCNIIIFYFIQNWE